MLLFCVDINGLIVLCPLPVTGLDMKRVGTGFLDRRCVLAIDKAVASRERLAGMGPRYEAVTCTSAPH
jgi:hypothetical protein